MENNLVLIWKENKDKWLPSESFEFEQVEQYLELLDINKEEIYSVEYSIIEFSKDGNSALLTMDVATKNDGIICYKIYFKFVSVFHEYVIANYKIVEKLLYEW